jgi:hypothetical protein
MTSVVIDSINLGEFPRLFKPGSPTTICTTLFLVAFQGFFDSLAKANELKESI